MPAQDRLPRALFDPDLLKKHSHDRLPLLWIPCRQLADDQLGQAPATIPIVMAAVADPVATGFVASLARPGGNITGISNMLPELVGKQTGAAQGGPSQGLLGGPPRESGQSEQRTARPPRLLSESVDSGDEQASGPTNPSSGSRFPGHRRSVADGFTATDDENVSVRGIGFEQ